jgi:mRNA interferase MazF
MVIERGEIWWANLGEPRGSSPGFHRPILIVQSDFFNRTQINTVIAAIITTNLRLANMPGNVGLSRKASGLDKESVVNISQLFTIDRVDLLEYVGNISAQKMEQIEKGLRLVLSL